MKILFSTILLLNTFVICAQPSSKYKILRGKTSYSDYEILIAQVDLKSITYKNTVRSVINDVAKFRNNVNYTAYIYDNLKAAELNYSDLQEGKQLNKANSRFVNEHLVAIYGKDMDGIIRIK